jgi:hypothetical protein
VRSCFALIALIAGTGLLAPSISAQASGEDTAPLATEPPVIPVGYDAFTQWARWPYLRIGVRAYMKSTFDRTGGNHNADAAHFIRQNEEDHGVVLDETGPGILWFVRHNHWHGSPWYYIVDGEETVVRETSTADPIDPVPGSVFMPEELFPQGLTYTWSTTKGANLSWVPIPFEDSFQLNYGRARYGTGYFIFWKVMPGLENVSRPIESWSGSEQDEPPQKVLDLLDRSGTDIAPSGENATTKSGGLSLDSYETTTVLQSEQGPAMMRRLAFRVPEESAEAFAKARLRVYWDGRKQPSIDAPLGLFFGTGSLLRKPDQEYIVKSFPMTVKWDDGNFVFATYFPMPFHESARIELSEKTGSTVEGVKWEVRHEPYDGPRNAVGWFHATYRDFPNPQPGRDLVFLNTRDEEGGGPWAGHFVGTTYIFTQRGNLSTLEGDPRFYFDGSRTPQAQGTGSEEWGGGGDYWGGRTMTLPFAGHPVGRPPAEADTDRERLHSAYRFLLSDLMPFGRSAKITFEHGRNSMSEEHYETVSYWYGIDKPGLVLSDEFDVGDPASEEDHDYRSPDASPVDTLSSRHELGADRVPLESGQQKQLYPPITDDGRRTTGATEFTLQLDANNLGVLLRRRLDLAYHDQKARVLVAADSGGERVWKKAGIWYTAGGNTVVFGDPRARPDSAQTMPLEIAPPVHQVETSNRRWRDDEFMIPRDLTEGRDQIRVRVEHIPVEKPLFSGHPLPKEAWTEYRYWAYNFVMPGLRESAQTSLEMVTRYGFGQVEGDTLRDQSENENDGIAHDVEIVRSERGAAGLFDGRGYVELETSSSDLKALRPNEKSLTVGGWARPDASDGVVASFGGQIEGFSLYLRDGIPEFAIRGLGQQSVVSGSERLPRNEWAHLAATLTADRQLRLYVNGKRVAATKAARFIESVPRDRFLVGADLRSSVGNTGASWRGLLDDVRVYWGVLGDSALDKWARDGNGPR